MSQSSIRNVGDKRDHFYVPHEAIYLREDVGHRYFERRFIRVEGKRHLHGL